MENVSEILKFVVREFNEKQMFKQRGTLSDLLSMTYIHVYI